MLHELQKRDLTRRSRLRVAVALAALLCACAPAVRPASAPAPASTPPASAAAPLSAELAPLGFLVGSWEGQGQGGIGASEGGFTLSSELGGQVLVRRGFNRSVSVNHEDMMVIYADHGALQAMFFDGEGHVIHYGVTAVDPKSAVFLSDEVAGAPRFRLTYQLGSGESLSVVFEVAPPGGEFKRYVEGTVTRK